MGVHRETLGLMMSTSTDCALDVISGWGLLDGVRPRRVSYVPDLVADCPSLYDCTEEHTE